MGIVGIVMVRECVEAGWVWFSFGLGWCGVMWCEVVYHGYSPDEVENVD